MTRAYIPLLFLMLLLTSTAQGQTLAVDQGDNPLTIKGWIGDDNSFIGNIGVTLEGAPQGSNAIKLNIYRSDLTMVNGSEMIGRQLVVVTGDANLTPNTTSTYQVKINSVREPGEYHGKITLALGDQPRSAAKTIDLIVFASVRPSLTLLTENDRLQANLVNCNYDCGLAHILLPDSAFQNKLDLAFEKPLAAPLVISDVAIAVKGDQTRFKLDADKLKISLDQFTQSQPPGGVSQATPQSSDPPAPSGGKNDPLTNKRYFTLPITIVTNDVGADHYSGSLYLTVAGQSNVIKVPVDFNVRTGPFWPLVMLLVSILLGRLFKFMQDKGNAIADALKLINRLELRLRDVHPDDAKIIERMVGDARDLLRQERTTEAVAAANAISARLSALGELRRIQTRLAGMEQTPPVTAILSDIDKAREEIELEQDEKAKTLITTIKDALVALVAAPSVADTDVILNEAIEKANFASAMLVIGTGRKELSHWLGNGLIALSGLSDEFRAEAALFLAKPIISLALLLGLLALGLKTLYIDNPVFGANPFTDFLGLMFWGLSSDVASRTLSNLVINKPSQPAGV